MTLFTAYLNSPKVRRTLTNMPGQEGFSLIELVVVIAILAILAAVAIPNFLNIQKDGQINAAQTTLATIVKECAVREARGETALALADAKSANGSLNGYGTPTSVGSSSCYDAKFTANTGTGLPNLAILLNNSTGAVTKTCTAGTYKSATVCDNWQ